MLPTNIRKDPSNAILSSRICQSGLIIVIVLLALSIEFVSSFTVSPQTRPLDTVTTTTTRHLRRTNALPNLLLLHDNNNHDDDGTATSSETSLLVSSSLIPPESSQPSLIHWDELLLAKYPIYCDPDDDECLLIQQEQQHGPLTTTTTTHQGISPVDWAWLSASLISAVAAFAVLLQISGPGSWRYYLAGGTCASVSHILPVPIDVVKTRKQVDPVIAQMSFGSALRQILQSEGHGALWNGLGPTAVGYLLEGALKFGVYEVLKPIVAPALAVLASRTHLTMIQSKWISYAVSAAISGVAASLLLCPMEALRIRMVANPDKKASWLKQGYRFLCEEGVGGFAKGIVPMLYKQVPYTMTKNVSFDFITKYSYSTLLLQTGAVGSLATTTVPFIAAALTSILSCITSQPGDMLLSLVNAKTGDRRRTRDIVHDILRSERGISGFFVGVKTRFLHVGVTVTLQLLIYDLVKRLCGVAATGMA
jgi:solute carrier family 25 phosphate transporter 3